MRHDRTADAVDQHGARAAHAVLAAEVGAGEAERSRRKSASVIAHFGVAPGGARR